MDNERKSLSVNQLDFDTIKQNMINFLQNQEEFKDYDFEGSGLSVILDLLSYYTHYQGVYNNFTASELFLDTAQKRSSVVSHAKSLGYVPFSRTAPTLTANCTFNNLTINTLPRGSRFLARVGNKSYNFTNIDPVSLSILDTNTGNGRFANNVELREGEIKSFSFVVPSSDANQKYRIDDPNADTKTLRVQVFKSVSDTSGVDDVWSEANNYTEITSTTNAFFVEEDFDGVYSIRFGDGVIGKKLSAGNLINVSYLQTNGPLANGVGKTDSSTSRALFYNEFSTIEVESAASGGSERESVASIRYNSPKSFSAQNRAVTTSDFEALVSNNFSGFRSVYCYGGEDANPPQFGKVFITLKPNSGSIITTSLKNSIQTFLQSKCSVGVSPEVIDAIQLYFRYNANVVYDPSKTILNEASLIAVIQQTISDYFEQNSQNFFSVVSISRMVKKILDSLVEVETISLTPSLEARFIPTPNAPSNYALNFANPIFHPHDGHEAVVTTNDFIYFDVDGNEVVVFAEDDGFGKVKLFNIVNGTKNVVEEDFGTVDYEKGVVTFNSFTIKELSGDVRVRSVISNNRLVANENYILAQDVQDSERNNVVMFPDDRPDRRIQTSTSGVSYVGTSSISSAFTASSTTSRSSSGSSSSSSISSSGSGGSSSSSGGGSY
tara:strand:- start:16802 stop:18793 length:1992 start_codon:yes stop_codon:yes gene_type:complete